MVIFMADEGTIPLLQIMANLTAGIWPHPHAPDDPKCMQLAFSKYGGFLGPYQEI